MQKAFCLEKFRQHLFLVEMPPDIFIIKLHTLYNIALVYH